MPRQIKQSSLAQGMRENVKREWLATLNAHAPSPEIAEAVYRSIIHGRGLQDLAPALKKLLKLTKTEASSEAIYQTTLAHVLLKMVRMRESGITRFEWFAMSGCHPYDEQIFDLDKLPIINEETGERGLPGQQRDCMCGMVPVLPMDESPKSALHKFMKRFKPTSR